MKRHIGIAAWTILLFSALQIAFGAGDQSDTVSSYRWNAVEITDGRKRLVEIKASRRLAKPVTQRKLEAARQFSAAEGWIFLTPKALHIKALGQRGGEAAKRHPG